MTYGAFMDQTKLKLLYNLELELRTLTTFYLIEKGSLNENLKRLLLEQLAARLIYFSKLHLQIVANRRDHGDVHIYTLIIRHILRSRLSHISRTIVNKAKIVLGL